jgi:type I restriction enzyme M protein
MSRKIRYFMAVKLARLYKGLDFMSDEEKRKLQKLLWDIADTLRGKMGADEFRDYILGFIFYKYLSEKMHIYADKILAEDGITFDQINEDSEEGIEYLKAIKVEALDKLGYFLKPSELFHAIASRNPTANNETKETEKKHASSFILDDLTQVLNHIEQSTMGTDSEDDFNKLFEDMDLTSTKLGRSEQQKNDLIAKVLGHLDGIDFQLQNAESDVLGDAYEYLIGQFASGAGKKAGEFYTPQQVSKILAKIVTDGKKKIKSVYDPTCGSGSLLLRVQKEVEEVSYFYGQELNRTTYNLARMNMILHDVHFAKFDIQQEDTLEHPQHLDKRFEAVVANPPFSAKWSANPLHMNDDRFSEYGKLAPSGKADFAFVQHTISHLDDNGTMAVVLPHGVLFRGAAEGHIRQYLIEDRNYLDAVIGLPANIFYGTSIPTCILVFKKCRKHPNNVLFIDASKHFEKAKNQNNLRDSDVQKIVDTYYNRTSEDKYSYVAPISEIKENDYNLNIPRYVDTFEEEEAINLKAVTDELKALEDDIAGTDKTIAAFCNELGIEAPFQLRKMINE